MLFLELIIFSINSVKLLNIFKFLVHNLKLRIYDRQNFHLTLLVEKIIVKISQRFRTSRQTDFSSVQVKITQKYYFNKDEKRWKKLLYHNKI